ncbi:MAG TPA: hypothetical protein VFL07_04295, partial [Rudaea sp.]|nr:hypothetical protein [Rudaea sp.]
MQRSGIRGSGWSGNTDASIRRSPDFAAPRLHPGYLVRSLADENDQGRLLGNTNNVARMQRSGIRVLLRQKPAEE